MILVVSSPRDSHTVEVLSRLDARGGRATLLDLSDFPRASDLAIHFHRTSGGALSRFAGRQGKFEFGDCRVVWWRRPQPFGFHPELADATDHSFAQAETFSAITGLWLTLDALWINHPTRDEEAARKVYQLQVAQQMGFRIPETCVTNSPAEARAFIDRQGERGTIYKAFTGTEAAWRETRLLKPEERGMLESVRLAPVIFQEHIPAEVDLRITVIGDRVFAGAIHSQETAYKVDFRMTMDQAAMTPHDMPEDLAEQLVSYLRRLGLLYGAIDMRLTPDGEYVFLEINPAGQWLFVENRTGLPITEALVDLMLAHAGSSADVSDLGRRAQQPQPNRSVSGPPPDAKNSVPTSV